MVPVLNYRDLIARENVCSASEHVVVCLPFVVAGCVYVNVRLRIMWVGM